MQYSALCVRSSKRHLTFIDNYFMTQPVYTVTIKQAGRQWAFPKHGEAGFIALYRRGKDARI